MMTIQAAAAAGMFMESNPIPHDKSRRTPPDPALETRDPAAPAGEHVEFSAEARAAAASEQAGASAPGADAPDPRVAAIRAEIANGTYLTPEKLDAAVEALCRELLGG